GDPSATPFVLEALRLDPDPDEVMENAPTIIGHLGAHAIPEVARFVLDESAPGMMRAAACDGLAAIALLHPFTRVPIVGFLRRFVEAAAQHQVEAVTGAVLALLELRDEESLPAIVRAFHAGRVDQDLITIDDAREAFDIPESISRDWHYTGDPLEFLSNESRQRLRRKYLHGRRG
ncbi:MAG: DUF1186 domain-containing protein, partial [Armatimonadota bacterium]|nr:DUF1186 domain-containing protein [Armatimonadota bacterium]